MIKKYLLGALSATLLVGCASTPNSSTTNSANASVDEHYAKIEQLLKKYESSADLVAGLPSKSAEQIKKGEELGKVAVEAFQKSDVKSWNSAVCQGSGVKESYTLENVAKRTGKISNVKLVKPGDATKAGNSGGRVPGYADVIYEVVSSIYPVNDGVMLLSFHYDADGKCLSVSI
jgi:hypothetical protein